MEKIIEQIQDISDSVIGWDIDTMQGFLQLKEIEKALKNSFKEIEKEVYNKIENYDLKDLPYGYTGTVNTRTIINYYSIPEYKEEKSKLQEFEKTLKQAVELSKQNKTLNDEDWMVIEVPEYKMKESFMVSKRR